MAEQYLSPIQSEGDARKLRRRLEVIGTGPALDAAVMLDRNWQGVAVRPRLAEQMIGMVEGDGSAEGRIECSLREVGEFLTRLRGDQRLGIQTGPQPQEQVIERYEGKYAALKQVLHDLETYPRRDA